MKLASRFAGGDLLPLRIGVLDSIRERHLYSINVVVMLTMTSTFSVRPTVDSSNSHLVTGVRRES